MHFVCVFRRVCTQHVWGQSCNLHQESWPLPRFLSHNHWCSVSITSLMCMCRNDWHGDSAPEPSLCWQLQDASQRLNNCQNVRWHHPLRSVTCSVLRAEHSGSQRWMSGLSCTHVHQHPKGSESPPFSAAYWWQNSKTLQSHVIKVTLGQAPLTSKRTAVRPTS